MDPGGTRLQHGFHLLRLLLPAAQEPQWKPDEMRDHRDCSSSPHTPSYPSPALHIHINFPLAVTCPSGWLISCLGFATERKQIVECTALRANEMAEPAQGLWGLRIRRIMIFSFWPPGTAAVFIRRRMWLVKTQSRSLKETAARGMLQHLAAGQAGCRCEEDVGTAPVSNWRTFERQREGGKERESVCVFCKALTNFNLDLGFHLAFKEVFYVICC